MFPIFRRVPGDSILQCKYKNLLILLTTLSSFYQAQDGYNYPRPDVALGTGSATIPAGGPNPVRPIVGGFPATNTGGGAAFTSGATAYGGNVNPTQAFGGFGQGQLPGSTFTSTGSGSGVTGTSGFPTASGGLAKRPTLQQRTGGIFGGSGTTGSSTGGQQQFTGGGGAQQSGGSSGNDGQYDGDYSAIPGQAGVNYPVYSQVPPTSFDCNQQPLPGYYSDVEAQCQVFHICALNRTYSFLCPNGTIFSQETLVCVWWNMFDCGSAPGLYPNNAFIYDYGNQGPPSNSGRFQQQQGSQPQLGIAGTATRPQNTFPTAGRATQPSGGVFSGNVRPTVQSGGFPAVSSGVSPVGAPSAFQGAAAGTAIFPGASNQPGASFPSGPPTTAPAAFGTTVRSGFSPIQEPATFPSSQVSSATSNREYLPPRRP